MSGELLKFPGDVVGMVLNLEEDNVGAVLFGSDKNIKEGDRVERTGRIASVPVGKAMKNLHGQTEHACPHQEQARGLIGETLLLCLERHPRGRRRSGRASDRGVPQGSRRAPPLT